MTPRDRLIVALDVADTATARAMVDRLAGHVGMFKVGSQIFTAAGPDCVREVIARGEKVFLDLKFHDIPNTVAGAVSSAGQLGVSLVDVHALGGKEMLEAAVGALPAMGIRLLAITILTSHKEETLGTIGGTEIAEPAVLPPSRGGQQLGHLSGQVESTVDWTAASPARELGLRMTRPAMALVRFR